MFGRNRVRYFPSYVDAWRAACVADSNHAIRRNAMVIALLMAADVWLLRGTWLIWPVYALGVWLFYNSAAWWSFRRKARLGLIYPPGQRPQPTANGSGRERHG